MKPFIGTKIVLAESMSKEEFDFRKNNLLNPDFGSPVETPEFHQCTPGYHVQYSNPDGSEYHSWSPISVFERAYREVSEDEKSLLTV